MPVSGVGARTQHLPGAGYNNWIVCRLRRLGAVIVVAAVLVGGCAHSERNIPITGDLSSFRPSESQGRLPTEVNVAAPTSVPVDGEVAPPSSEPRKDKLATREEEADQLVDQRHDPMRWCSVLDSDQVEGIERHFFNADHAAIQGAAERAAEFGSTTADTFDVWVEGHAEEALAVRSARTEIEVAIQEVWAGVEENWSRVWDAWASPNLPFGDYVPTRGDALRWALAILGDIEASNWVAVGDAWATASARWDSFVANGVSRRSQAVVDAAEDARIKLAEAAEAWDRWMSAVETTAQLQDEIVRAVYSADQATRSAYFAYWAARAVAEGFSWHSSEAATAQSSASADLARAADATTAEAREAWTASSIAWEVARDAWVAAEALRDSLVESAGVTAEDDGVPPALEIAAIVEDASWDAAGENGFRSYWISHERDDVLWWEYVRDEGFDPVGDPFHRRPDGDGQGNTDVPTAYIGDVWDAALLANGAGKDADSASRGVYGLYGSEAMSVVAARDSAGESLAAAESVVWDGAATAYDAAFCQ